MPSIEQKIVGGIRIAIPYQNKEDVSAKHWDIVSQKSEQSFLKKMNAMQFQRPNTAYN